jgi:hypothetical protein
MVIRVPELTTNASVRFVAVSLPYVAALIDGQKYREPGEMPRLQGSEAYRQRAPRGPTLRSLVKLALRCDTAEQMGLKLKRRFERQQRRHGIKPGRARQAEAELDRLLAQD